MGKTISRSSPQATFLAVLSGFFILGGLLGARERPNILWLTTEDHGPHLGCYGDPDAQTPNLDTFAKKSLLYTKASSNAPICAPARTTLITGMYATSLGAANMRSELDIPDWLVLFPDLLRKNGYFCANNPKTDYNLSINDKSIWDESSGKAHYKHAPTDKPFFVVFNYKGTHESKIRNANPNPLHDPSEITVPPYMPDTLEVRKDWAQYHDRITEMDQWFGKKIRELEKRGHAEDTIVFFFSDHGSGMPRSKRYVGWSGTHVPLLVHIPEKFAYLRPANYQAGAKSDRLVSFVDMAPTPMALIGEQAAEYHEGHAFLGDKLPPAPEYSFAFQDRMDERLDCSRAVTDGYYLYIRNFMRDVPTLKFLEYQMKTPSTRIWKKLYDARQLNPVQAAAWKTPRPLEALYNLKKDPYETKNIAAGHPELLSKFRAALADHLNTIHDLGLLPESLVHELSDARNISPAEFARHNGFHLKIDGTHFHLLDKKGHPVPGNRADDPLPPFDEKTEARLAAESESDSPAVRTHALKLLSLANPSPEIADQLLALSDPQSNSPYVALEAINALSHYTSLSKKQYKKLSKLDTNPPKNCPPRFKGYSERIHKHLLEKFKR